MKMLILNGPGLADLSGLDGYADITLGAIKDACAQQCATLGVDLDFRHTEDAQQIKTWLDEDLGGFDALVLNPQGVAATVSQADRRGIENALDNRVPAVEVHLSQALANALANVSTDGAEAAGPLRPSNCDLGFVSGLGINSYLLAIKALHRRLRPLAESA